MDPMNMLAHMTLVEASSLVSVFLLGLVIGLATATSWARRRVASRSDDSR